MVAMLAQSDRPRVAADDRPAMSRDRLAFAVLLAMFTAGIVLSALLVAPFVPALVWAFALVVVADPLHQWILARVRYVNISAGVTVFLVGLVLLIPASFLAWQIGAQASQRFQEVQYFLDSGSLRQLLRRLPTAARVYDWLTQSHGTTLPAAELMPSVQNQASVWLRSALGGTMQILIALFTLFFLFRDRDRVVATFRSFMPMSDGETDYFFERIRRMTYATIYGNVVVAIAQGGLGGLMFALLGIKGALLWGVVMAVLSLLPNAGAFLIWVPTAVYMAIDGDWLKASILARWGAIVVSSIDNLLYPMLVGREVRVHTLPVFFSVVGGLLLFGAAGIVLGPVILAGTTALADILRRRTVHSRSAVEPR